MNIKSLIPLRMKMYLSFLIHKIFTGKNRIKLSLDQRIWVFLYADYGNLGDVAISKAQYNFLKNKFPKSEIVKIPISQTLKVLPMIQKIINQNDLITITGGGNMSDLYDDIEYLRQLIINMFPKHKISSFPQSLYLSDTRYGQKRLKKAKNAYNNHPSLTLLARDPVSFSYMRQYFPKVKVKLYPDIVLSQIYVKNNKRDRTLLFCLRKDQEQNGLNIFMIKSLQNYISNHFDCVKCLDTQVLNEDVKLDGGDRCLYELLDTFSRAGLVVTDRLHGMIFSFITRTPALVFDNKTHKISATYFWIKECGYIHLVNETTDFSSLHFEDNFTKTKLRIDSLFNEMI